MAGEIMEARGYEVGFAREGNEAISVYQPALA